MIALILVSALLAIISIALIFSVRLNLKLGKMILVVEDQIEESLDILDESYHRLTAITEIPVMSDEPVIRDVLSTIGRARYAVLEVANKLIVFENESQEDTDADDQGTG